MKSILLSIRPEWLAKILNGEKTIEVRKLFPKDYVGWIYLYCSKSKPYLLNKLTRDVCFWEEKQITANDMLNGKVVARFWCDKVDRYINGCNVAKKYTTFNDFEKILTPACIYTDELENYCEDLSFFAIHISKLEIFDRPKELRKFYKVGFKSAIEQAVYIQNKSMRNNKIDLIEDEYKLTKAPQNYCYVEGE